MSIDVRDLLNKERTLEQDAADILAEIRNRRQKVKKANEQQSQSDAYDRAMQGI